MQLLSRLISCDAAGAPLVGETAQETEADIGALLPYRLLVGCDSHCAYMLAAD